eukprot:scaffold87567_cov65-Phaeocystis_antarctica.AAC.2
MFWARSAATALAPRLATSLYPKSGAAMCNEEAGGREVHYVVTRGEGRNVHHHQAKVMVLGQP